MLILLIQGGCLKIGIKHVVCWNYFFKTDVLNMVQSFLRPKWVDIYL